MKLERRWQNSRTLFRLLLVGLFWGLILSSIQAQVPLEPGWRVFTEPSFGFQIHYPENWHVSLAADNTQRSQDYDESVAMRSIGFFGPNSQIVFVDIWVNQSGRPLSDWLKHYPAPIAADPTMVQTTEFATVAGRAAIRNVALPANNNPRTPRHYRTQFAQGDLIFSIEHVALELNQKVYEQMLASFQFKKPTKARLAASTLSDALPPATYGVMTADCCGVTDFEYNPFPCNTAGDAPCPAPPCGNCTWWVRYRRTGGSEANLVHCTNDALTWQGCANQYYPHLLSPEPDEEAVVLYGGLNHLSFVEAVSGNNFFNVSDLSWDISCPARYYTTSTGSDKTFIHHPATFVPNIPPNRPLLLTPEDDAWLASRTATLTWEDGGDPDDGPQLTRNFLAHIWNDDWTKHSGWLNNKTEWQVDVPEDGFYSWRVKAHDGTLESGWTTTREFGVDTKSPQVIISAGAPPIERWYKTDQTFSWRASDPSPGSGISHFRWAWDDDTPDKKVTASSGSTTLSAAGQGMHQLYLQATDNLGHTSAVTRLGWFGYDTIAPQITPDPNAPASGYWYNYRPTLAWTFNDPAPGIGLAATQWVWNQRLLLEKNFAINQSDQATGSTVLPPAQGQHTFYYLAWDKLINVTHIEAWGWFGYDSLLPEPPAINPGCEALNNQWQNRCRQPNFTWQSDDPNGAAGSGLQDYKYVWGPAIEPKGGAWSDKTSYAPDPITTPTGTAKSYLHVWARDAAGNISSPATFGLWYDGTAPTVSFLADQGLDLMTSSTVRLHLSAIDTDSGLESIRIANNDRVWSAWQPYADQVEWALSTTDASPHIIAVQVRDRAGNESRVITKTVEMTHLAVEAGPSEPAGQIRQSDAITQPDRFGITLNDQALYTNIPTVTVKLWAPNVVQMRLSQNSAFANQDWQPFQAQATQAWRLAGEGNSIAPSRVYVWFRDAAGSVYGPYFDDIIYDAVPPAGALKTLALDGTTISLLLYAQDNNSGVVEMRFVTDPASPAAPWEAYTTMVTRPTNQGVAYVQFRDLAGNLSPVYGSDGSNSAQTEKRYLPLFWR